MLGFFGEYSNAFPYFCRSENGKLLMVKKLIWFTDQKPPNEI
jgi:hypothetical protein